MAETRPAAKALLMRALALYANGCPEADRADVADLLARLDLSDAHKVQAAIAAPLPPRQAVLGVPDAGPAGGLQAVFPFARPVDR